MLLYVFIMYKAIICKTDYIIIIVIIINIIIIIIIIVK